MHAVLCGVVSDCSTVPGLAVCKEEVSGGSRTCQSSATCSACTDGEYCTQDDICQAAGAIAIFSIVFFIDLCFSILLFKFGL